MVCHHMRVIRTRSGRVVVMCSKKNICSTRRTSVSFDLFAILQIIRIMAAIKRDVICLKIDCVTANCIIIASLKYVCALLHRYSSIFWTVRLCLYLGGFSSLPYRINVIPNEKQFYFFVSPTEKRIIVAKK